METITEDYCSYEVAKLLKEKGFDEPCKSAYIWNTEEYELCALFSKPLHFNREGGLEDYEDDSVPRISAPTHQMAMKWLREVHKLHIGIVRGPKGYHITIETIPLGVVKYITREIVGTTYVDSYEKAVEAALKYSLENLI